MRSSPLLPVSIAAALVAIVFLIYSQVHAHAFINFDDPTYVSQNAHVSHGLTWIGVKWAFTRIHAAYWIPLTWISHMIDVDLFGMNAGAQLLVSVSLHAINCVLLFFFLRKATASMWRSAIVAGLFAVHPLHVESVAWISERKDTLSTLFFMLCLIGYAYWAMHRSRAAYAASVAALAAGMLAKPMLVSTPVVLLLLDYWPFARTGIRRLIVEKIPFALCIVPSAIATLFAQREAMPQISSVSPLIRIANAAISYVRYVGKTFWPAGLSIIYPFPTRINAAAAILCGLLVIAATIAVIVFRRSAPWLFTGWCWFVVTLIPVIGIIQVGLQAMADRFTYIPHIGFFIAVVWSCSELTSRYGMPRALPATAAALAIVSLAFVAHAQVGYWAGNVPLFEHALAVTSPENKMAHFNLAAGYMQEGAYDAAQREYQLAGELPSASDGRYIALTRLGNAEFANGKLPEARAHFAEAVTVKPDDYDLRMNYGTLLSRLALNSEAAEQFAYAAKLHPQSAEPHVYAALVLAKSRPDLASHEVELAIALDHDAANRILVNAIRIPSRPRAIDEYLVFLMQQSRGH